VTPNAALRDGDQVTVTGRSYPIRAFAPGAEAEGDDGPARPVSLHQCPVTATSYRDCHYRSGDVGMSPAGNFRTQLGLRYRLFLHTGATVDCRTEPCALVATSNGEFSEAGLVPLAFDPDGPGGPPPTVTVEPATGLIDGQVVSITARGLLPNQGIELNLCPPGARGYGFLACHDVFDLSLVGATNGEVRMTHAVHARFQPSIGPAVDCRVSACEFVVTWSGNVGNAPAARIELDPAAPLVSPDLTADRTTGLAARQRIQVTGDGYYPTGFTRVAQCVARPQQDRDACAEDDQLVILDEGGDQTSFTTPLVVLRSVFTDGGRVNCARRHCYLASYDFENGEVRGPRLRFLAG
jgi:hypothetical protein